MRINMLMSLLQPVGMQLAVIPKAGFFTLWRAPKKAFGRKVEDGEHFNELMINRNGIIGVPFGPYIRYAVVAEVEKWIGHIAESFKKARVSY